MLVSRQVPKFCESLHGGRGPRNSDRDLSSKNKKAIYNFIQVEWAYLLWFLVFRLDCCFKFAIKWRIGYKEMENFGWLAAGRMAYVLGVFGPRARVSFSFR